MAINVAPINVPQTTPNAIQFQPPTDLVNAYLARQQQGNQFAINQISNLGEFVNKLQQQKIQNQLGALGAVSQLYAAGGPRAVQQYAPQLNQMGGGSMVPQTSQPAQMPTQQQGQNAPTIPDQTGQPATQGSVGTGISAANTQAPVSPYIQASLAAGHPDVAGIGQKYAQQAQGFNAPQPTPEDLADIQSGGTYGRNKAQSYMDLGNMAMQPITAQQKGLEIQKTQNDIGMQPTENALKQQQLVNAQQEIPQKQKATIAGEVSKESQSTQNITQLKTLAGNLQTALQGNKPGLLSNQSGNLYQATGGRYGSASAAAVQNAANPLATALNTELARRFNSGEVALLSQSLIPQPKDTPAYAQQKIDNLNKLLDSMASGNENNVKNVAAAITSGTIPSIGQSQPQNIQTISSDAAFKALPSGAQFKDPSGQVHRKK